jgi:hypothetical protein
MSDFINGFIANSLAIVLCHPLDLIKTNIQKERSAYTSTMGGIYNIYKNRGIVGFYRGLSVNLITYPPFWGIYFSLMKSQKAANIEYEVNQFLKSKLFENTWACSLIDNINPGKATICYLSGITASTVCNSLFVVKTRLQAGATIRTAISQGKFMKGTLATYITNLKIGIYFPLFYYLNGNGRDRSSYQNNFSTFTAGIISKTIANIIVYPLDVVRTQLRLEPHNSLWKVLKKNNAVCYYKGIFIYNIYSCAQFVIMMYSLEYISKKI